jgi:hypothetical protein
MSTSSKLNSLLIGLQTLSYCGESRERVRSPLCAISCKSCSLESSAQPRRSPRPRGAVPAHPDQPTHGLIQAGLVPTHVPTLTPTHDPIREHAPTHRIAEQARVPTPTPPQDRAGVPIAPVVPATPEAASSAARKRSMILNGVTRAQRPERPPGAAQDMSSTMLCRSSAAARTHQAICSGRRRLMQKPRMRSSRHSN